MSEIVDITVPDIGDFEEVEVVEILVSPGDEVEVGASLISIESDKATIEVPSPHPGIVREILVELGDRVSQGSLIARIETEEAAIAEAAPQPKAAPPEARAAPQPLVAASPAPAPTEPEESRSFTPSDRHAQLVVLGGGPGGYTAAFRAADLDKEVVLVERHPTLGGVCLNVGCIPSKALLHIAEVITEARGLSAHGVDFGAPALDLERIRASKERTVARLTKGLAGLAKRRKVTVLNGAGRFSAPDQITVDLHEGEITTISFDDCIVAVGSRSIQMPGFPSDDPRLWDSTDALRLDEVPERLLVIGGGVIGLEMATVYDALGAEVTVVELLDGLMPGTDRDLVEPLRKRIASRYQNVFCSTRVTRIQPEAKGLRVFFDGPDAPDSDLFDRVLVAVGRRPNADAVNPEAAGLDLDERGFIPVDARQRTRVPHVYAIGDVTGPPMLAHKATHQGKTAAEVIAGLAAAFDARAIPSVAYTDPEIAWAGLTEEQAQEQSIAYEKAVFPWSASGRALGIGRSEGLTKILIDPGTRALLGAGVVGRNAGELIAEAVLALEMGADTEDLGLTIHAHPTLSETLAFAAETAEGTITDLYSPRRR
jgi:dihydrolipoamide dehydrogenase